MKRILIATDGSEDAHKALDLAADLARGFQAELLIVHVVGYATVSAEDKILIETEYAEEVADRLNQGGLAPAGDTEILSAPPVSAYGDPTPVFRDLLGERVLVSAETSARMAGATNVHTILSHGDAAIQILAVARDNAVDTIVVGGRGLGELQGLLLGSVSSKVAHLALCTVVLVR